MEERIGFKSSRLRKAFFSAVKDSSNAKNLTELRNMLELPRTSFQNYQYGRQLLPAELFDSMLQVISEEKQVFFFEQTFTRPGNWDAKKGGKKGIRPLIKKIRKKESQRMEEESRKKICSKPEQMD